MDSIDEIKVILLDKSRSSYERKDALFQLKNHDLSNVSEFLDPLLEATIH